MGVLPGAGAQIKNQKVPELELMALWEVAPGPGPFLDTNGFAELTEG